MTQIKCSDHDQLGNLELGVLTWDVQDRPEEIS